MAEQEAARRLADSPVILHIDDPDGRLGPCPLVGLYREERRPDVLHRSLLMRRKGKGLFIGWMPVQLDRIALLADARGAKEGRPPRLRIRRMPLAELFLRCAFAAPVTVLRALRLLGVRNRKGFEFRIFRLCNSLTAPAYGQWLAARQMEESALMKADSRPECPLVIVSSPGDEAALRAALDGQTYRDFMVARPAEVRAAAARYPKRDCLWLPLPEGMRLSPDALEHLTQPFMTEPALAACYSDEDVADGAGRHHSPLFRPGWNPPLAQSGWLRVDAALFRLRHLPEALPIETMAATELLIEAATQGRVGHVPRILMHRRVSKPARAPPAIPAPRPPEPVSIVIPTRDRADLLAACLDGLWSGTDHNGLDIIVIDNDSREESALQLLERHEAAGRIRRLPMPGQFNFAHACNLGAAAARHERLLLLNNDIEPLARDWLAHLSAELNDPAVGAAGALLLFPDGSVQHGGVTLGGDSVARHSFHFLYPQAGEDRGLLAQRRHVSAVTAACLLTRRSLWQKLGGMNERDLAVAFNDVDYCLKLREKGLSVIWTPHARLLHRESVSRGADSTPEKQARFAHEERYMHERWAEALLNDPFHNPNLSLTGEDFALEARPRDLRARILP